MQVVCVCVHSISMEVMSVCEMTSTCVNIIMFPYGVLAHLVNLTIKCQQLELSLSQFEREGVAQLEAVTSLVSHAERGGAGYEIITSLAPRPSVTHYRACHYDWKFTWKCLITGVSLVITMWLLLATATANDQSHTQPPSCKGLVKRVALTRPAGMQ